MDNRNRLVAAALSVLSLSPFAAAGPFSLWKRLPVQVSVVTQGPFTYQGWFVTPDHKDRVIEALIS
jgi:hypothetical protein